MNFEQSLRLAGLRPREVIADGKIRRCTTESKPGKRNGWYVLHLDGRGSWGDWTSGSGEALGHWKDEQASVTAPSTATVEKLKQQRVRERAARIEAIRAARWYWSQAASNKAAVHPYIRNKGLSPQGCSGLRTFGGLLVVPVWYGDRLSSVQTIDADGTKRFWPGAPVKAGAFLLTRPRSAVTVLAEGLATGLAVYQCVAQSSVIVAFDAGNLLPVAQRLKPHGTVVVAADNDHETQARRGFNPGLEKARNVADLLGCGVAYPTDLMGSDWADALKEWGERAPKRIEREILGEAKYVRNGA